MATTEPTTARGIVVALPESALDMVPVGIAKTDRKGNITYANRQMLNITGLEDWRGRTVADVFSGDDLARVHEELDSRFEQRAGSVYAVELTRKDGRRVPVSITAFPETNEANEVVGSLGIFRDLTLETAQRRMYHLVEKESETNKLLDAVTEALRPLVPFDRVGVIRLNRGRTHLRSIYPPPGQGGVPEPAFRWWQIPKPIRHLLDSKEILVINDLRRWYEDPARASMLEDPAVQDFLNQGFVSTMSLPVSQSGEQVASITLYRKAGRPFSAEERDIADQLPLAEAVSVALRNETEGNLTFLIELMKHISSAYDSVGDVAQTIVEKISKHYGWDYVSIYQVYEHRNEIRLIAQRAKTDSLLSRKMSHPLDTGIIGYVYRQKKGVNIGDIASSPEFSEVYVPHRNIRTRSELCVPVGAESQWLLNVEDERANAFAPEEKRDLESIAAGLSTLLKRTLEYHYRRAIVERANDAIILVDKTGTILEVNPATWTLLGGSRSQFEGRPIEDFFVDRQEAKALMREDKSFPNHEVAMRHGAVEGAVGSAVKVLLSVATLPEETGGKIFVASDMRQMDRIKQLELAQDFYREVTGQVKTPMSLAISWLRRYAQHHGLGTDDVPHKVIQQLQKAELTLDRVMLLERREGDEVRHEVLVCVDDLVESVLLDMPAREREVVATNLASGNAYVRASVYELRYCLQTVVSYLLRLAAEVDRVELNVRRRGEEIEVTVAGRLPPTSVCEGDLEAACRAGQVRAEISLGRETLKRLAGLNRGRFAETVAESRDRVMFSFAFPVVQTGARS